MSLTDFQRELCTTSRWDFTGLRALYVNCTLKPSPEPSHTQGLMDVSIAIMRENGVETDLVRAVDHQLAPGVWPDMREHGADRDDWPELYERIRGRRTSSCSGRPSGSGRSPRCALASSSGCTPARAS